MKSHTQRMTLHGKLSAAGAAAAMAINAQVPGQCQHWQLMSTGTNSWVHALAVHEGVLIAGGIFFIDAGGQSFAGVVRWDGSSWQPLGDGFDGIVHALTIYDGDLIAGGDFTTADGQAVSKIARWDGTTWQPLGSGLDNGKVSALTVYNGELIAGGDFVFAGDEIVQMIARWDGSSWHALGTGLDYNWTDEHGVWAMTVYEGDLIIGGQFDAAGGQFIENDIARWNGSAWQAMGNIGFTRVQALAVHNQDLIAGAEGGTGGTMQPKRWTGQAWESVGGGVNGIVEAMIVHDGDLIAAGAFSEAGEQAVNDIARWDGSNWQAVGNGIGLAYAPEALAIHNGELIVGGAFTPDMVQIEGLVARWTEGIAVPWGTPVITQSPVDQIVAVGDAVMFSVVASGSAPLTYQWRKSGVALSDGGTISGSTTTTLTISTTAAADFGAYDVIVVSNCLSATSAPAALAVTSSCPTDVAPPTGDGLVNLSDLLAVISAWGSCP